MAQADPTLEGALRGLRKALQSGDFGALDHAGAVIEDSLAGLDATDPARMEVLRRLAQDNLALIEAAARGLRTARQRLQDIRSAPRGIATYDRCGQRRTIGGPAGGKTLRA